MEVAMAGEHLRKDVEAEIHRHPTSCRSDIVAMDMVSKPWHQVLPATASSPLPRRVRLHGEEVAACPSNAVALSRSRPVSTADTSSCLPPAASHHGDLAAASPAKDMKALRSSWRAAPSTSSLPRLAWYLDKDVDALSATSCNLPRRPSDHDDLAAAGTVKDVEALCSSWCVAPSTSSLPRFAWYQDEDMKALSANPSNLRRCALRRGDLEVADPGNDMVSSWNGRLTASSSSTRHMEATKGRKEGKPSLPRQTVRPRGGVGSFSRDIVLAIGRKLVQSSRKDVVSMKTAFKAWGDMLETTGPWLVVSLPTSPKIITLKLNAQEGGAATLDVVDCICPPPPGASICWGAANGLMALRNDETNKIYLHCPVCGYENVMAELADTMTPKGVFFRDAPVILAIMEITEEEDLSILLCHQEFSDEENGGEDEEGEIQLTWAPYPGAETYTMNSVNFTTGMSFVGVESGYRVILDEIERGIDEDMVEVSVHVEVDPSLMPWNENRSHVFVCGEEIYACFLFRSRQDTSIVRTKVFRLQHDDDQGYHFIPVSDIGPNCVFLGSNQAVVMPSRDNFAARNRNTIYVEDNDGVSHCRIVAINLETQEAIVIPFPQSCITAMDNSR